MKTTKHLYIHVPFCKTICSYCDFCHRVYDEELSNKWLITLEDEIKSKCINDYETIYIGGGTPTSLSDNQLENLLNLIQPYSKKVVEYTIEVNPESLDLSKINIFKKYGVNRVSMGVQTSNDNLLKLLNRRHTYRDVVEKINLLKNNGLKNISIDLMYSLPNQTIEILNKTLDDFVDLDIPHVSLYSLTIEENSLFAKKGFKSLDDDIEADMYELIIKKLERSGYSHYEVSNFAKAGYESKHNIGYWKYDDFLGISAGASSKIGDHRYSNTKNISKYISDFNSKDENLILTKEDLMFENIMMSLRMKDGLDINEFDNKYNVNLLEKYSDALNNNNLLIDNGHIKVKNLALLNNTLLDFLK